MEPIFNEYTPKIYTPISEIKLELARRQTDHTLRLAVEQFWGELFPNFLLDYTVPLAFFSRPTITPNFEFLFFLDIAELFSTPPLLMEFADKFVTKNEAKYYVASMHIEKSTRNGGTIFEKNTLIDIPYWEGKQLDTITTYHGNNLQKLHHELLIRQHPEFKNSIHDITVWFDRVRKHYETYYLGYLALGIYHGVIFENFVFDDEKELDFFEKKVLPSLDAIEEIFGIKPLIHPILPLRNAKLDRWYCYPQSTAETLHQLDV